jgi:mRNA interferase RelE/StbE
VPYALLYHPRVAEEDLPGIPGNLQRRIDRAAGERLAASPERYGAPLRGALRGYWKLRVGDYRVIFKIVGSSVWVLKIGHRRTVYAHLVGRLDWRPGAVSERGRRYRRRGRRVTAPRTRRILSLR